MLKNHLKSILLFLLFLNHFTSYSLSHRSDSPKQNEQECPICCDRIADTKLNCNHKMCHRCTVTIYETSAKCPFCRAELTPNDLIVIDDTAASNAAGKKKDLEEELDKLETLKKLLQERIADTSTNKKILIFSEYYRTFDKMTDILSQLNIRYSKIQGTTNTVMKKIREYKSVDEDSIDCLLLNAEYCASGLNLENTTDIIITHKMSNEKMTQIIGRGQRPGRTTPLNVWKLCYENEIPV